MADKELLRFSEFLSTYHIPRWNELPDIELYMDQLVMIVQRIISAVKGARDDNMLTAAMINNYVKQGVMPAPVKKRYGRAHIASLIIICFVKDILSIGQIKDLLCDAVAGIMHERAYNVFCQRQEEAFEYVHALVASDVQKIESCPLTKDSLACNMITLANAAKITAGNLLVPATCTKETNTHQPSSK